MTPYDKVREAVVKANPEIMRLEFGCWVRLKVYDEDGPYRVLEECGICLKHKTRRGRRKR